MRNGAVQRSAQRLSALTAMVLTLGFGGVVNGVVLCFGGDGHLAIEAVGPDGCAEVVESAAPAASAVAAPLAASHCGPCVDVMLTSTSAAEGVKAAKRMPSPASALSTSELRPPVSQLRARVAYQHHTRRFISEKPHTVIIRC